MLNCCSECTSLSLFDVQRYRVGSKDRPDGGSRIADQFDCLLRTLVKSYCNLGSIKKEQTINLEASVKIQSKKTKNVTFIDLFTLVIHLKKLWHICICHPSFNIDSFLNLLSFQCNAGNRRVSSARFLIGMFVIFLLRQHCGSSPWTFLCATKISTPKIRFQLEAPSQWAHHCQSSLIPLV